MKQSIEFTEQELQDLHILLSYSDNECYVALLLKVDAALKNLKK